MIRFRENGSGMLLDFDSVAESLDFSFPTIPNASGRGSFFVSDSPILSLKKQAVNIDTTQEYAKLNVSTENGPQLSILNPSNTPVHSDFTVVRRHPLIAASSTAICVAPAALGGNAVDHCLRAQIDRHALTHGTGCSRPCAGAI